MSTLRPPSINTGACSGLTLSGALYTTLKSGVWRGRMGQIDIDKYSGFL
jgi:hypothetical protein